LKERNRLKEKRENVPFSLRKRKKTTRKRKVLEEGF